MILKMLASMAGNDFSLSVGDETDRFDDAEAGRLLAAGFAEVVDPEDAERALAAADDAAALKAAAEAELEAALAEPTEDVGEAEVPEMEQRAETTDKARPRGKETR